MRKGPRVPASLVLLSLSRELGLPPSAQSWKSQDVDQLAHFPATQASAGFIHCHATVSLQLNTLEKEADRTHRQWTNSHGQDLYSFQSSLFQGRTFCLQQSEGSAPLLHFHSAKPSQPNL